MYSHLCAKPYRGCELPPRYLPNSPKWRQSQSIHTVPWFLENTWNLCRERLSVLQWWDFSDGYSHRLPVRILTSELSTQELNQVPCRKGIEFYPLDSSYGERGKYRGKEEINVSITSPFAPFSSWPAIIMLQIKRKEGPPYFLFVRSQLLLQEHASESRFDPCFCISRRAPLQGPRFHCYHKQEELLRHRRPWLDTRWAA